MARYRHASIFLDSKKIGKCSGGTYRLTSATEAQINDDGYAGESEAPFTLELTANTIEQVGSSGIDVMSIMLQRKQITITYATLEGKIHEAKLCRATQCETTWSSQNGTHTGSYTFRGPPPKLVG